MRNVVTLYCDVIINPIIKRRDKLLKCIYSKDLLNILFYKSNKKHLDRVEILLHKEYQKLGKIIVDKRNNK